MSDPDAMTKAWDFMAEGVRFLHHEYVEADISLQLANLVRNHGRPSHVKWQDPMFPIFPSSSRIYIQIDISTFYTLCSDVRVGIRRRDHSGFRRHSPRAASGSLDFEGSSQYSSPTFHCIRHCEEKESFEGWKPTQALVSFIQEYSKSVVHRSLKDRGHWCTRVISLWVNSWLFRNIPPAFALG